MKLIPLIAASIYSLTLVGFVSSVLWGYFMTPLGLPVLNMFHAAGIALLISVMMGTRGIPVITPKDIKSVLQETKSNTNDAKFSESAPKESSSYESTLYWYEIIMITYISVFSLIFGYIIHRLMFVI